MSWNFSAVGTPPKLIEALRAQSQKETGQCKVEFDGALPHLEGLLAQNFAADCHPTLKLTASGHGHQVGGKLSACCCLVSLEVFSTKILGLALLAVLVLASVAGGPVLAQDNLLLDPTTPVANNLLIQDPAVELDRLIDDTEHAYALNALPVPAWMTDLKRKNQPLPRAQFVSANTQPNLQHLLAPGRMVDLQDSLTADYPAEDLMTQCRNGSCASGGRWSNDVGGHTHTRTHSDGQRWGSRLRPRNWFRGRGVPVLRRWRR